MVLGPARLGARLGLASELFRERGPEGGAVDAVFWRWDGRAGEDSRLELAVEGVERFSERGTPPFMKVGCRRVGPVSETGEGEWVRFARGSRRRVVVVGMLAGRRGLLAGSVDSGAPVMERKDEESRSWDEVMATWGFSAAAGTVA